MIEFVVRNRAPVYLVVACVTIFGLVSYIGLPREAQPDVKIPLVMVTTPYIGVSPADVESLVTVPLESELAGIKDLKKMSSTSAEGASVVTLEFEPEVVIEDALQRVRDRVSRARPKIPEDAEETEVREVSFSDVPVLIVTIAGPIDEEELKKLGENLEEDVSRIGGVLDAKLAGGRDRQIRVYVDAVRLMHYKLKLDDVIGAIANENTNTPGGEVTTGTASYLLRVPGEFVAPNEIENVAIKRVGDRPVFVRDVARVVDGYEERQTYARMNQNGAVSLAVTKRTGANILKVAEAVKEKTEEHSKTWPAGVTYRALGDQSRFVRDMVTDLENNILNALLLVVGVILFFLGVRNSMFVAITIPLSMLLSFIIIDSFGMTLNMVVLFSLILALGMLVDNGIVLVENIYRHHEEGKDVVRASIDGAKEVAGAVTASTLTTVAAFAPMIFWTGIMGQFMGYLPKTVVIVLVSSLLMAIFVLPALTAAFMKLSPKKIKQVQTPRDNEWMERYTRLLGWSIDNRYKTMLFGIGVFVVTFIFYIPLNHGTEFFPSVQPDRAIVSVRAPDGTNLDATDAILQKIEKAVVVEENVDVYVAEAGVGGGGDPLAGSQAVPNIARVTVDFLPTAEKAKDDDKIRVENTTNTIDRFRGILKNIVGANIDVEKENFGPPVGAPIAVEVSGEDFHEVGKLAAKVKRDLAKIEGIAELDDDYRVGRPEMQLRIDRGAAKRVGASTGAIASTIRTAIAGTKASALRDGEDEHDIVVQLDPKDRQDLQSVLNLRIPGREDTSPDTFPVPISTVASYELIGGSGSIRHIDQDLVVTITGDVQEGANANVVRGLVEDYIEQKKMPTGYAMRLGGENDEQRAAQAFLLRAFGIAIFLILFVLVTNFSRFDIPAIILASVVLSLVGVLWGLILTGTPFGIMMTGIGIISLAGVVVNNAIVLLDYVEKLRARGMQMRDALIQAGATRFRPVVLTAITTILGLMPMATGITIDFRGLRIVTGSQSADWWGPMAVAVIFGLAVATVLTLVLVPTMYSIFEDLRNYLRAGKQVSKEGTEPPATSAVGSI